MTKLLAAGLWRYWRSSVTWISLGASIFMGVLCGMNINLEESIKVDYFLFPPLIFAVLISLSIGREFSDGTVRNKVIAGHKKGHIFFSELILALGFCSLLWAVFAAIVGMLNRPVLSRSPDDVNADVFIGLYFLSIAFAAMQVLISVLINNKAVVAIVNLLLVLAITLFASSLHSDLRQPKFYRDPRPSYDAETGEMKMEVKLTENKNYIDGIRRDVYELVVDILPGGQLIECGAVMDEYRSAENPGQLTDEQYDSLHRHPYYSLALILVLCVSGWLAFSKKDLK